LFPDQHRPAAPSHAAGRPHKEKSSGPAGSLNRPFVEFINEQSDLGKQHNDDNGQMRYPRKITPTNLKLAVL